MKTLSSVMLLVVVCGCSVSHISKGDFKAFNGRFIWNTEGFRASLSTNGSGTISIEKSNPDAQTAEAVARGVAAGMTGK